jgi:hypothetical protein
MPTNNKSAQLQSLLTIKLPNCNAYNNKTAQLQCLLTINLKQPNVMTEAAHFYNKLDLPLTQCYFKPLSPSDRYTSACCSILTEQQRYCGD